MKKRIKKSYTAIVVGRRWKTGTFDAFALHLRLNTDHFRAVPGQFVLLEPMNEQSVMPRPFSIVAVDKNEITVLIGIVGKNTEAYASLTIGDKIRVIGPRGRPIRLNPGVKSYILVAGGIGSAGLTFLAKRLVKRKKTVKVLIGVKDSSLTLGTGFFEDLGLKTEIIAETGGQKIGLVTDLLKKNLAKDGACSTTVIACGPKAMLKAVADMCARKGNECMVVVEEIMACGSGSCKGCAVYCTDNKVRHVCEDGPAFNARLINWPSFIRKPRVKVKSKPLSRSALKVKIGKLVLRYPIMNASGCLDVGALEREEINISGLGALVTKGVTLEPRAGNPMPRVCETSSGMINSIGLENVGIRKFIRYKLPKWLIFGKPVIVNIAGSTIGEYAELIELLEGTGVAGYEVNISCPNVNRGGIAFGTDRTVAGILVDLVREKTKKPLIVKLTPNTSDIVGVARSVVAAGADAVSLINTFPALGFDSRTGNPIIGGLSGPAIRPIALQMVYQLSQTRLGVPIIGMGGIEDVNSAVEFFRVGASLVAIGTGSFRQSDIFAKLNKCFCDY